VRFCETCGMLLSPAAGAEVEVDERTERARKIQPRYARGETVRVAVAGNLAEAELMQNILLEEGIPSMLRRSGGFDVPDFLAAGPRDILVPEAGAEAAKELLAGVQADQPEASTAAGGERPLRLAAGLLVALAGAAGLIWVLYQLSS
jgi:hypothetical protein